MPKKTTKKAKVATKKVAPKKTVKKAVKKAAPKKVAKKAAPKKVVKKAVKKAAPKKVAPKKAPAKAVSKKKSTEGWEEKAQLLILKGRGRGFITYNEILKEFPNVEQDVMFLDTLYEKP